MQLSYRALPCLLIPAALLLAGCAKAPGPSIGQDAPPSVSEQSQSAISQGLTPEILQQFQDELNRQAGAMMQAGSAMTGEQASAMMQQLQQMMQAPQ